MRSTATRGLLLVALALAVPAVASASIVMDGSRDVHYGAAISTQTTQSNFGDNNLGVVDNANGSELDAAHGIIQNGRLYLFLAGSLESNFNKLEIFFDSRSGGQAKLRGDNPNVDFNGLNRMGDDGSNNGLRFDAGFDADYWIGMGGGGGPYQLFVNFAELTVGGVGNFLGQTGAGGNGTLTGGTNPDGIQVSIDNRNTAGVTGGCLAASGAGVARGIEVSIPLSAIGNPSGAVRVTAFVNGGGHDFVSNQVVGPLAAGTCNLGEPRSVNFGTQAGDQFFQVDHGKVPMSAPWVLAVMSALLAGGALITMRRRATA